MSVTPGNTKGVGKLLRVAFCESFDQRVLRAAHTLNQHRLAHVVLLGRRDELDKAAVGYRTSLQGIEVVDYESDPVQSSIKSTLAELGIAESNDPADPAVAGAWLVRSSLADAVIGGAATTPTHMMRVYLRLLGVVDGCDTMSGISLVTFEGCDFVRSETVGLADVSVVAEPTVEQLADIAIQSASSYQRMTGNQARVAFLSFSTLGSSESPAARKIRQAVELTNSRKPDLTVDGEIQIDSALVPAAAGAKCPSSLVGGSANVLIFPNLDAGNIAVKIFQRFSDYRVLGPILQGLAYPCTYIPRASSAEDILNQVRLLLC